MKENQIRYYGYYAVMIAKNDEIYSVVITGADMDLKNSLELEKYLVGLWFATGDKKTVSLHFLRKRNPISAWVHNSHFMKDFKAMKWFGFCNIIIGSIL